MTFMRFVAVLPPRGANDLYKLESFEHSRFDRGRHCHPHDFCRYRRRCHLLHRLHLCRQNVCHVFGYDDSSAAETKKSKNKLATMTKCAWKLGGRSQAPY